MNTFVTFLYGDEALGSFVGCGLVALISLILLRFVSGLAWGLVPGVANLALFWYWAIGMNGAQLDHFWKQLAMAILVTGIYAAFAVVARYDRRQPQTA